MREEIISVIITGNTLYQNCHLLILKCQPPLLPILQCIRVHGTCVHSSYSIFKCGQPFFGGTLINAKNTFIFSCKSISKVILLQGTGTDNNWRLPEIFQHPYKFFPYTFREASPKKLVAEGFRHRKISFITLLLKADTPPAIIYNICIINICSQKERIIRFQIVCNFTHLPLGSLNNLSCKKHAHTFSSDVSCPDLTGYNFQKILQSEIFPAKILDSFFFSNKQTDQKISHLLLLLLRLIQELPCIIHGHIPEIKPLFIPLKRRKQLCCLAAGGDAFISVPFNTMRKKHSR